MSASAWEYFSAIFARGTWIIIDIEYLTVLCNVPNVIFPIQNGKNYDWRHLLYRFGDFPIEAYDMKMTILGALEFTSKMTKRRCLAFRCIQVHYARPQAVDLSGLFYIYYSRSEFIFLSYSGVTEVALRACERVYQLRSERWKLYAILCQATNVIVIVLVLRSL